VIDRVHGVADAHLEHACSAQVVGELLAGEALDERLESIAGEGCFLVTLTFGELVHSFVEQHSDRLWRRTECVEYPIDGDVV